MAEDAPVETAFLEGNRRLGDRIGVPQIGPVAPAKRVGMGEQDAIGGPFIPPWKRAHPAAILELRRCPFDRFGDPIWKGGAIAAGLAPLHVEDIVVSGDQDRSVARRRFLGDFQASHRFRTVGEQVAEDHEPVESFVSRRVEGVKKLLGGGMDVAEDRNLQFELRIRPLPGVAITAKLLHNPASCVIAPQRSCARGNAKVGKARKVLIVGSFAPSLTRFRGSFIEAMVKAGHSVVAAAPQVDMATREAVQKLGADVREIALSNASLNPLGLLNSIEAMRRLIREERPDVLIAYTIKPVIAAALAGRAEKVPTIVSLITGAGYAFTGGSEPKRVVSRIAASLLYRIALKRSDVIIFQNRDDEGLFRRLGLVPRGRETGMVNGSGIDLDHFSPAPLPRNTCFLMISRLLRDKGIREFAEAAKRLKSTHPEVPIVLVGGFDPSPDSLSKAELDELIRCGIDYRGHVDDVRPAIADCSVYVLPSYREGTPRSVLEAMAMGRAIITTDAPGCRETVENDVNGLLVRPRDADSLYRAMLRMAENPNLVPKMGAASRRLAESKYDVREVNSKLMRYAGLSC